MTNSTELNNTITAAFRMLINCSVEELNGSLDNLTYNERLAAKVLARMIKDNIDGTIRQ